MDEPHHGLQIYTNPQSGRTPPWVKNLVHKVDGHNQNRTNKSTKWTDPTRAKLMQIQKVNGPSRDQTYAKKGERTLQTFKTPINIMNGPNQLIKLYKSIMDSHQRSRPHSTE